MPVRPAISSPSHRLACFGPVDIGEVGQRMLPYVDQPDLAGWKRIAVIVQDAHVGIWQWAARGTRMALPVGRIDEGGVARLAGAIGFGDHRAEPVDHRLLQWHRAGRSGGSDLLE